MLYASLTKLIKASLSLSLLLFSSLSTLSVLLLFSFSLAFWFLLSSLLFSVISSFLSSSFATSGVCSSCLLDSKDGFLSSETFGQESSSSFFSFCTCGFTSDSCTFSFSSSFSLVDTSGVCVSGVSFSTTSFEISSFLTSSFSIFAALDDVSFLTMIVSLGIFCSFISSKVINLLSSLYDKSLFLDCVDIFFALLFTLLFNCSVDEFCWFILGKIIHVVVTTDADEINIVANNFFCTRLIIKFFILSPPLYENYNINLFLMSNKLTL